FFLSEQLTISLLVWLTVANAFGSGLLEIVAARKFRRHIDATMLTLAGSFSVVMSVVLVLARNTNTSRLVSVLGVYAMLYCAVLISFFLRLYDIKRRLHLAHHNRE